STYGGRTRGPGLTCAGVRTVGRRGSKQDWTEQAGPKSAHKVRVIVRTCPVMRRVMKDAPRRLNAGDRTRFAQATDPGNTSKISQPFFSTRHLAG
ncbi:hypothetical protein B296_00058806, partial [Ensete ventricosum]